MDIERFKRSPIGRLKPIRGTDGFNRPFDHFAYIPDPLPSTIELSGTTWNVVSAAGFALGRLEGEGRRLPNPANLARPAIRAEAISSSALEGTYTTFPQILQSELLEDDLSSDEAEVLDYVRAAEMAYREIAEGQPLSLNLIKRVHKRLMASDPKCPPQEKGEIRSQQNFIGPRPDSEITEAHFVPPPPGDDLRDGLYAWESWLHNTDVNILVRMAVGHYQFEALHPFFDGNGRMGRLVTTLLLLHEGSLTVPLLNISPYLEAHRVTYQDHLRELSVTGDFDPWVRFFAEGVRAQSEHALSKIDELLSIREAMLNDLHQHKVRGAALRIADDVIGYPLLTPRSVADRYGITWQAATNALNSLEERGHLRRIPWRSNRLLYRHDAVVQAIHG